MLNYNQKVTNKYDIKTLPVPDLSKTMDKFLEWVEPLVKEEEYLEGKKQVESFMNSNVSRELQEVLLEKAKDKDGNWLIDWWLNYIYLTSRGPLAPENNASFFINLPSLKYEKPYERIGAVLYASAVFYNRLKNEGVPDFIFRDKQYSLDQLHGLLGGLRIPRLGIDEYYINDEQSSNIVFSYKNRIFNIEVIKNNKPIPYEKIAATIKQILEGNFESKIPNANYIGLSTNRDDASVLLDKLLENNKNKEAHDLIKDSILYASYDDYIAEDEVDWANHMLYNRDDINRWPGKSLSLMFSKGKDMSMIADHTYVDGGTQVYFIQEIDNIISTISPNTKEIQETQEINEIEFDLSEDIVSELEKYKEDYIGYVNNIKFKLIKFENLNRKILRDNDVVSGDGFIHLAFQMAQKKTFGTYYNTYIAVDNRTFFKGRTECIRPVTNQSITFIEEFMKKEKSSQELFDLMEASLDEHYKRTKECQAGHGVNRHLLGLSMAYKEKSKEYKEENELPLFDTSIWKTIGSNRLSTSSVPSPYIPKLCFQPVEDGGFGIGYVVGDESYVFASAYKKDLGMLEKFTENLSESIGELISFIKNKEIV